MLVNSRKDLIDLINQGKIKGSLTLGTLILALGGTFLDAYDFGSIGIGVVQLTQQLHLTSLEIGSLTASMAFGALFGALIGGKIIDKSGRMMMFVIDLVLFVLGAIGSALSINIYMLMFFRVLLGLGVGIDFPVALSMIAEVSNIKNKGRNVNLWQSMWYISTVLVYIIAFVLYLNYNIFGINVWRYVIGFGAIPALIIVILRYKYMGESPLWVFSRGSVKEINEYLKKENYTGIEVKTLGSPITTRGFKTLFTKKYRKRTMLSASMAIEESMEYYSIAFYLPVTLVLLFKGDVLIALLATAAINVAGIFGGTLQSIFTFKIKIKKLAMIGLMGVFISLLILGITGPTIIIAASIILLLSFVFFHSFGQGSQAMTIGTLSYPVNIRGKGSGFTQTMVRVGSIIGFFAFPLLKASIGLYKTILVISIFPLIVFLITLFIKWDPTDLNVDDEEFSDSESGGNPEPNAN
jgi:MFS family permease